MHNFVNLTAITALVETDADKLLGRAAILRMLKVPQPRLHQL